MAVEEARCGDERQDQHGVALKHDRQCSSKRFRAYVGRQGKARLACQLSQ